MGSHSRPSPLACAAMRAILAAPADDPADTDTIISALGRREFRVLMVLARLKRKGWVTSERAGEDQVWRPAYDSCWYEARITSERDQLK
jgi:predicted transcriptional regulator